MTRGHRNLHRLLWPALAFIVAFAFTMSLVLRPPPDEPEAPSASSASETRVNALMPEPAK